MYIVNIINGNITTPIHNNSQKLKSGNIVKGINAIDSFSFTLLPDNAGFDLINNFTTLVSVYNTNKKRYDFFGRVLYSNSTMDSKGLITKEVTCESCFGYLCDSQQPYVYTQNWTVTSLLQHIIDKHNEQLEEYKRFKIGEVTVTDPNDNLYLGIQRENAWKTIQDKLIGKLGGEIRFRVESDGLYIDYLTEIGETRSTTIEMSKNMKSIAKEVDPSSFITRLIPLGCKLKKEVDGEEVETEDRLDITSVNDGKNYIEIENAVDVYGIHIGYAYWDDVTSPSILLTKARNYLAENNKVQIKYSITALDLSLLGLDIDDFDVHNYHPIINPLLGIDDIARIIKKNIDVCDETKSTIEVGENFKTLSEIQWEQTQNLKNEIDKVKLDTSELSGKVTQTQQSMNGFDSKIEEIKTTVESYQTEIDRTQAEVAIMASKSYVEKSTFEEYKEDVSSEFAVNAETVNVKINRATEQINNVDGDLQSKFEKVSKHFGFTLNGLVIGGGENAITLSIDNEGGVVFSKNGVPFGWWDGIDFHTGNIVVAVNERAQFGNFAFIPRSSGSLSFLKVKGSNASGAQHTHSYTEAITKAATCTETGIKAFMCSCGHSYTEVIEATGHDYTSNITPPTPTEQGYTTHICANCGDRYVDSYTDYYKTIEVSVSPEGAGAVTGCGQYKTGSPVTLTAVPENGYEFSHWNLYNPEYDQTIENVSTDNPWNIKATSTVIATAVFKTKL